MTYYDGNLRALQERVQRKAHLEPKLEELKERKKKLEPNLKLWEIYAHNEQIDVDKLEGNGLTSMLYGLIGKKEEKLEKERAEAREWALKRDEAKRELEEIDIEIERIERELSSLENCKREYVKALDERLEAIKKSGVADVDHAFILEEKISYCESQMCEINEALSLLEECEDVAAEILSELSDAENWGNIDMFSGGKIADMKKYDHIDNAEMLTKKLRKMLVILKSEIADVVTDIETEVSLGEFSSTADWLFDNIFTASAVLDEIKEAENNVQTTLGQLKKSRRTLENAKEALLVDKAKCQIKRDTLK